MSFLAKDLLFLSPMTAPRIAFFAVLAFVGLAGLVFIKEQARVRSTEPGAAMEAPDGRGGSSAALRTLNDPRAGMTRRAQGSSLKPDSRFRAAPDPASPLETEAERLYRDSPANSTAECQAILKILTENGYGFRHLERAYTIAMQLHSMNSAEERIKSGQAEVTINDEPYDPSNPEHVKIHNRTKQHRTDVARIELSQALDLDWPNDAQTVEDILKIAPTVPYRPLR